MLTASLLFCKKYSLFTDAYWLGGVHCLMLSIALKIVKVEKFHVNLKHWNKSIVGASVCVCIMFDRRSYLTPSQLLSSVKVYCLLCSIEFIGSQWKSSHLQSAYPHLGFCGCCFFCIMPEYDILGHFICLLFVQSSIFYKWFYCFISHLVLKSS